MLQEDSTERAQFDSATRDVYGGRALAQVQSILNSFAKQFPERGSFAKMLAICANEVEMVVQRDDAGSPALKDLAQKAAAFDRAADAVFRAGHALDRQLASRAATGPEIAILACRIQLRRQGWGWGPDGVTAQMAPPPQTNPTGERP